MLLTRNGVELVAGIDLTRLATLDSLTLTLPPFLPLRRWVMPLLTVWLIHPSGVLCSPTNSEGGTVQVVAAVLQVLGAVALSVAAWIVTPAAGIAVAGVALVVFGLAVER